MELSTQQTKQRYMYLLLTSDRLNGRLHSYLHNRRNARKVVFLTTVKAQNSLTFLNSKSRTAIIIQYIVQYPLIL